MGRTPGGKSPNVFFADVIESDNDYFDKAPEGRTINVRAMNVRAGSWRRLAERRKSG